jgi:sugar lactone lactonase YvrE
MSRIRITPPHVVAALAVVLFAGVVGSRLARLSPIPAHPAPAFNGADMMPISMAQNGPKLSLEGGVGWINTAAPIHLEDLRGKFVLLDFWTYCCINCHHVLPDLAKLEQKYAKNLVVIGVHTAKFDAEKKTENIRQKVDEYGIKHPVINDANQELWNRFNVSSWPTLVLLGPSGEYIGYVAGEGNYEILDQTIGKLVAQAREKKLLDETPLHFPAESDKPRDTVLAYPGKIVADEAGKRLFISDTANNRIVVTDLDGKHLFTAGTGEVGAADGPAQSAQFHRPQGMCLVGSTLYVADTENHMIRALDLDAKTVATVAGTGEQSHQRTGGGPALKTGLNSPWDLVLLPDSKTLFIAMAGPHQIWTLDLAKNVVSVFAGNGREDIRDSKLATASFAQPSGLATDGKHLFVADSEGSCVRSINLANKTVMTLAGTHDLPQGQSLFAFGDVDGVGDGARLQHCLGLAYGDGVIYVADSYNNKIRTLAPKTQTLKTLAGTRAGGTSDDPPRFNEPGGLSLAGNTLYIADTNNSAIRALNLETKAVRTLPLDGVTAPNPPQRKPTFPGAKVIDVAGVEVAPGTSFTVDVTLAVPDGFKVSPDAPMPYLIETADASEILANGRISPPASSFPLTVALGKTAKAGDSLTLKVSVGAFLCKSNQLCQIRNFVWNVPVTFADGADGGVALTTAEAVAGKEVDVDAE